MFQTCCFPKCTFTKAVVSRIELFQSYKFPKLRFSQLALVQTLHSLDRYSFVQPVHVAAQATSADPCCASCWR